MMDMDASIWKWVVNGVRLLLPDYFSLIGTADRPE